MCAVGVFALGSWLILFPLAPFSRSSCSFCLCFGGLRRRCSLDHSAAAAPLIVHLTGIAADLPFHSEGCARRSYRCAHQPVSTPRHWSDSPGWSRGTSACPIESEGESAGIISMRSPTQCHSNTGRICFFLILSRPSGVKLSYRHAASSVFDVTAMSLPRCMDLQSLMRRYITLSLTVQAPFSVLNILLRAIKVLRLAARTFRGAERAFV